MSIKRTRFVEDAKLDPGRYYRHPSDIIRDRRLTNKDRLDIVIAWERDTLASIASQDAAIGTEDKLGQLERLRTELEQNFDGDRAPK